MIIVQFYFESLFRAIELENNKSVPSNFAIEHNCVIQRFLQNRRRSIHIDFYVVKQFA